MGTNYYWYSEQACPTCKRVCEPIHIGKSSAGWCFALHVTKEIPDLGTWKELFTKTGSYIKDEYNHPISAEEMIFIITERSGHIEWEERKWGLQNFGMYESEDDFHKINFSERGRNNLAQVKIDGKRCIAHGEGPWDLIQGEFS